MHRRHLQEIPDLGSNISTSFTWAWDPSKTSELFSGMGVSALKDKLGNENTPQELLMCVGPPPKRQKVKDKEFVIARRPRLPREVATGISWDTLPDELLLGIFSYLSLTELLKVSQVCQRWHRLSIDESLWQTLDLSNKSLRPGVIGQLLPLGVIAFRCPRSCVGDPLFKTSRPLQVQHMDLSSCTIKVTDLQSILVHCQSLQNLSLEGLELSDDILRNIAQNPSLVRLNFSGCSGFSAEALEATLNSCTRLEELNLAWCDFTADHVRVAVNHIPPGLTQLNLSGYRQNLLMSEVKTLLERCSNLVHLDLSDSVMLKPECFQYFHQLTCLEHLGLSRCYQIPPAALLELGKIATLKTVQLFGIVTASSLQLLKAMLPHIKVNSSHFTPIARPTIGGNKNEAIWGTRCRLSLRNPSGF
ncbi:S-phase kinase-associated protein 2 isoform X2 [Hemicordylus capensis]|uniref:S-phase kinase-associated protein 2 isoform X2 n=1 Tax=Hemicordylus capensis TaxID=884348 RepID=UPI0023042F21|nr:S-phase kinase-associated protein 2 isoform X2 [Hemicordylus capensis]